MSKIAATNNNLIEKRMEISQMSRKELEQVVLRLTTNLEESSMKLSWYEEQFRRAKQQKFGSSSEKNADAAQISFCNVTDSTSAARPCPTGWSVLQSCG